MCAVKFDGQFGCKRFQHRHRLHKISKKGRMTKKSKETTAIRNVYFVTPKNLVK